MEVSKTNLNDVKIIQPKIFEDNRGYFFESYKSTVFSKNNFSSDFLQDNEVKSKHGVLRGLHYQLKEPQGKLIRVVLGSIIDVAVDIRLGSPTFGQYHLVKLTAENKTMFFIPEGFAHGYLVTSKESIVLYKCTNIYNPDDQYGIRWDDEDIGIKWNNQNPILSEKDKNLPSLKNQKFLPKY